MEFSTGWSGLGLWWVGRRARGMGGLPGVRLWSWCLPGSIVVHQKSPKPLILLDRLRKENRFSEMLKTLKGKAARRRGPSQPLYGP